MLQEMWYDLFIIALSGHLSRDFCSIPKQTLQWTGVGNSLFLGGCQAVLPSEIHNVLQSIRYQGTRCSITPNLSFEPGKINNSLHIKKEDTKRQKKIAFSPLILSMIILYNFYYPNLFLKCFNKKFLWINNMKCWLKICRRNNAHSLT